MATSGPRRTTVEAGKVLWHAQLGHDWEVLKDNPDESIEVPCAYPPERMFPLRYGASEGRANPKGSRIYTWQRRRIPLL